MRLILLRKAHLDKMSSEKNICTQLIENLNIFIFLVSTNCPKKTKLKAPITTYQSSRLWLMNKEKRAKSKKWFVLLMQREQRLLLRTPRQCALPEPWKEKESK